MRILFIIESLAAGGKERRLIELLTFLKTKGRYEMRVLMTRPEVDYKSFHELEIPYEVAERRRFRKDPTLFYRFFKICRIFRPDIIHTWGPMPTFYALPTRNLLGIPLINGQITNSSPKKGALNFDRFVNTVNFRFSDILLSNSKAGLEAYNASGNHARVIYNGIRPERLSPQKTVDAIRAEYGIKTNFLVLMLANLTASKKNELFVDVANRVHARRNDITFVHAGRARDKNLLETLRGKNLFPDRTIFAGTVAEVGSLINAADIGLLFTHGEGISNAIMEYMCLGKPVIAHRYGGTGELVAQGESGYLLDHDNPEKIGRMITGLIDDPEKCRAMGNAGRQIIHNRFTIEAMGSAFEELYQEVFHRFRRRHSQSM